MHDWLMTDAQLALSIPVALGQVAVALVSSATVVPEKFTVSRRGACPGYSKISNTLPEDVKGLATAAVTTALSHGTHRQLRGRWTLNDPPLAA